MINTHMKCLNCLIAMLSVLMRLIEGERGWSLDVSPEIKLTVPTSMGKH